MFCLIGFTIQSQAQVNFRLGIKGGLNFSDLETDLNTDSKTGYHGGAFMTFKFTKLAIQPEVIFSQQGAKFHFNGDEIESNYSYVNIPVLLKLYLIGGLNLQVGPQFGFLATAERDEFNQLTQSKSKEDVKDQLKNSEMSVGLGLGWDLPSGFLISARYNLGLTEINDAEPTWNAKNQVFQVSLGYRLIDIGN